jgi:hypothetical protein
MGHAPGPLRTTSGLHRAGVRNAGSRRGGCYRSCYWGLRCRRSLACVFLLAPLETFRGQCRLQKYHFFPPYS